jgi:hypothetical protein
MTSRLDDNDLDSRWRDGLRAAVPFVDMRHAPERVVSRIRQRKRRRAGTALVATFAMLLVAVGVVLTYRDGGSPSIHTAGRGPAPHDGGSPTARLHVTSDASLFMHLDRATVPAGVIEIVYLDGGGTHELRIDRVPNFLLRVPFGPTVARVRLTPGRYVLYCDLPGHRAAGEEAVLTVTARPRRPS